MASPESPGSNAVADAAPDALILGKPVFGPEAPQLRLQGRKLSVALSLVGPGSLSAVTDNGDGTYKYTFHRDITKVKDAVAAAALAVVSP